MGVGVVTIFDICRPRADVLAGQVAEADFAADLAQVVKGVASREYADPARFFANTYPNEGLRRLLANVCRRLSGAGGEAAAIFRLDTSYDGGNADPANGRAMGEGVLAHTPWGEIAFALAGAEGYERVRASDEQRVAPGAETLRELFGGEPALILIDELSVYLRKVRRMANAGDQLTAFLTSLFQAVESAPNVALVYTLAIGSDGRATDAYSEENQFIAESAYLDDRPGAPMRFLAEPNLTKLIQTEDQNVDASEARAHLDDRIREIFVGTVFDAVRFPGGPFDVPDEVADGKPKLVVLAYDGVAIGTSVERIPDLVQRIYERKGAEGSALRSLRNNLAFVAADDARKEDMRRKVRRRLALAELKKPDRLEQLADHQKDKILELERKSESELAVAIQQCYRHVFYPSRNRLPRSTVDLAHTAIDVPSASDRPGAGQQQIVRVLRDLNKLRLAEDEPDSPAYVRDRTPLRKGQMTTLELRGEFRRDPALPMLVGDDVFVRGIRNGIESGEYVYRRDELLYGPGDPVAAIAIDAQAAVLTMVFARNKGIWPRPKVDPEAHDGGGTYSGQPDTDQPPDTPSVPDTTNPPPPVPGAIAAEGLLAEALTKLWEQARDRDVAAIGRLNIRLFEAGDAFRLLGAVGSVPGAKKTVTLAGGYETREGGTFELEFTGPVQDAQPVREFLEPQLRDAAERTLEGEFDLEFANGLSLQGDAAEKMTERLSRFASGAAYVTATAEAAD